MNKLIACITAALLLALPGCVTPAVEVKHQGEQRLLASHDTYAVIDHSVGSTPTTRLAFNTKVHPIMARKGYERAPAHEADLLVSFKALWRSSTDSPTQKLTSSEAPSIGSAILGMEDPMGDVQKVVLVTVEEAKTDRVVWVGWTNVEVDRDRVIMSTSSSFDEILKLIPKRSN